MHVKHFWNNILRFIAHLKKSAGVQLPLSKDSNTAVRSNLTLLHHFLKQLPGSSSSACAHGTDCYHTQSKWPVAFSQLSTVSHLLCHVGTNNKERQMLVTYAAFNTTYIQYHNGIQCTATQQINVPPLQAFLNLISDVNNPMSTSLFRSPPFYLFLIIIPQKYIKWWFNCARIISEFGRKSCRLPSSLEHTAKALDIMSTTILIFHCTWFHVLQSLTLIGKYAITTVAGTSLLLRPWTVPWKSCKTFNPKQAVQHSEMQCSHIFSSAN